MKQKTTLLFLWHMHQPYYKDTLNNIYIMPWVRLHATKGYYDIPLVMEKHGIRGCINMVPSLLEQIEDYVNNSVTDKWHIYTVRHPGEMSEEEKAFLLKNFFMLHWDRLVKTSPRYFEILSKREKYYAKDLSWNDMTRFFSVDEFLDLQVLFNLKWFGFMAREHYPFLVKMDAKDRFFTQEEKMEIVKIQQEIMKNIIPLYKRLLTEDKIEISFTPFYHPIFPLVYDTEISRRSAPNAPMPPRFAYPQDAQWHIEEGKRYSESLWGQKISGMWPAEGSVCPEIVDAVSTAGVKWIATDDGILFRSLGNYDKIKTLYKPYALESERGKIVSFFRDKYLSDQIGFAFAKMEKEKAVSTFTNYIHAITAQTPDDYPDPVISVILDGENAWETYPNNGADFLNELFSQISQSREIVTDTFSGWIEKNEKYRFPVIQRLHSGSWINSDYMIWIGNDEDNTAWDFLRRVRKFWDDYQLQHKDLPEKIKEEVLRSLYRAEGSDWFWWYGDSFSTENDYLFDRLFRRHLRKVYNLLGVNYPTYLDVPIKASSRIEVNLEPTGYISPIVSGVQDSYYEWSGAGIYDNNKRPGGSMYNSVKIVDRFHYGFDRNNLYFKVKLLEPILFYEHRKHILKCYIMSKNDVDLALPVVRFEANPFNISLSNESGKLNEIVEAGKAALDDVLEIELSLRKAGFKPGQKLSVYFKIFSHDGLEVERVPEAGMLNITLPDDRYATKMWDV